MASTSRRLDVEHVQTLVEASFKGLRISVTGGGVTSRDLLTGNFEGQALVVTVRRPGRVRDLVSTYRAGVYLVSEHFRRSVTRLGASTVKDLVAGSGLVFEDAGERELKGVPDRWRLYRVVSL